MAKKGLTKERIVDMALKQIEMQGLSAFSLRTLAASLEVQVSSLYNHIAGQQELLTEVGLRAVDMLIERENAAIRGKEKDEALYSLADEYRRFAMEHKELYQIIMDVHILEIPVLETAAKKIIGPILSILSQYGLNEETQFHYQRILRSIIHGFFAHETSGGFTASISRDASYHLAIACVIDALKKEGVRVETG